ncbi:biotin carboxylase [Caballeronia sp. SEWSISQ10-4 2]|uniref:ATP-grasp domain-containing protein n=1 Tax=Caballeronia sp. SEWSISQ10-4 2 TaxID=2937438 RepID=UPI00264C025D|nr:biotin carboxylase [Caballeronia sp. SEWSISQ10-4 2]MDN7177162.1 biotin carboxylase [Caballeronia sp. SEWSISQ10-4 2]
MNAHARFLLIVDYNLSRISDVTHIARYARERHGAHTILIRPNPTAADAQLCDHLIDLDPLADGFVDAALGCLKPWRNGLKAGLVFSDNAVQRGAELLERLCLPVDSATLAAGAFSKRDYRISEARIRDLLASQYVMVPEYIEVSSVDDLQRFATMHPDGFVVKPSCEGNNRGVVIVKPGDSSGDTFRAGFSAVEPYLNHGAICEALIPFRREFSFDGVGATEFITEKVSASGCYPVEVAQILPARINATERATLVRTGRLANMLVGQCHGPFHNEIKLDDAGLQAAVIEPNRRPAGMKIWTIAADVYGVDFYALWVDAAFGVFREPALVPAARQAATVMLGVPFNCVFTPPDSAQGVALFDRTLARAAALLGAESMRRLEFSWLAKDTHFIPAIPRDNSDFAAQACFVLDSDTIDIGSAVAVVRATWLSLVTEMPDVFDLPATEISATDHSPFVAV